MILLVFICFLISSFAAELPKAQEFSVTRPVGALDSNLWTQCVNVPILKNVCIDIYAIPSNLTLGVELSIEGKVYMSVPIIEANRLCLDDTALLRLLQANPILVPFWPAIEAIILAEKVIPAHVFSVCAVVYDLNLNSTEASGCALLDANLMCFNKCLWAGEAKFGCFRVPLPFKEDRDNLL